MAQSARFHQLVRRISALDNGLLPVTQVNGNYTLPEYDRVRSFRVLAHAEIEACIEDLAFATATRAFSKWLADGRARIPIVAMVCYAEGILAFPSLLAPSGAAEEVKHRVEKAMNAYCHGLKVRNNGVKEANILRILLPVGVTLAEIDPTWLATIDSFGSTRGETAHSSALKVVTQPDPVTERTTVGQIVKGLAPIDVRLRSLSR